MAAEKRYVVRCKNGDIHTVITVDYDSDLPVDLVDVHDRHAFQCSPHRVRTEPARREGVLAAWWPW